MVLKNTSSFPNQEMSYVDLWNQHKAHFYNSERIPTNTRWYSQLTGPMPIRRDYIDHYTQRFANGEVMIERSFPALSVDDSLPNIVELGMWWIAYLIQNNGYHGLRSVRTPSSTTFEKGVLCISLLTNDALGVSPSFRE